MPPPTRNAPQSQDETTFRNPPLWFHEAGKWLFSRREARKRAVIRLIDRLPKKNQGQTPPE
jgi:hypothetical protein